MANAHISKEKYAQMAEKRRGQKRSKETCKKISDALMGHKHSPETLAKMRKPRSLEARKNISNACKGRVSPNKGKKGIFSEETLKRLSISHRGKITSPEKKMKLREAMIRYFKSVNPLYEPPAYYLGTLDRQHESIRRDRIRKNGGHHTKKQWQDLKSAYNFTCKMCNRKEPEIKLTKDHIISIRHGGSNDISNIQPLCRSCNSKKR